MKKITWDKQEEIPEVENHDFELNNYVDCIYDYNAGYKKCDAANNYLRRWFMYMFKNIFEDQNLNVIERLFNGDVESINIFFSYIAIV